MKAAITVKMVGRNSEYKVSFSNTQNSVPNKSCQLIKNYVVCSLILISVVWEGKSEVINHVGPKHKTIIENFKNRLSHLHSHTLEIVPFLYLSHHSTQKAPSGFKTQSKWE